MRTIGSVLEQNRGLGPGFDFLRIGLALSVLAWHVPFVAIASDAHVHTRFVWIFAYTLVMAFFGLSGFLIAGSALRLSLGNFLVNRALRILPALAVEIGLAVLFIGPLFSTLTLANYFHNATTFHYLTNAIGLMNYYLPGVFLQNPLHEVNAPIWTVPFEMECYALMSCLVLLGLLRRPWTTLAIPAVILAVGLVLCFTGHRGHQPGINEDWVDHLFFGGGSRLFIGFSLGIAGFLYRNHIVYSWKLFALSSVFLLVVAGVGRSGFPTYPTPIVTAITAVPVTYVMIFIGCTKIRLPPHFGDYSYGIYLYHWPVLQVLRALLPSIANHSAVLLLLGVPVTTLFAALSWHVIEKPVLKMRKNFSFVARQRLVQRENDVMLPTAKLAYTPPGLSTPSARGAAVNAGQRPPTSA